LSTLVVYTKNHPCYI